MKKKHQKTLESIFKVPVQANVGWKDVEALLIALDAEITQGSGSRVRIALKDIKAVFHRPHPNKKIDKGALMSIRRFLINAGIKP